MNNIIYMSFREEIKNAIQKSGKKKKKRAKAKNQVL